MSAPVSRSEPERTNPAVAVGANQAVSLSSARLGEIVVRKRKRIRWNKIPIYVWFFGVLLLVIVLAAALAPLIAPRDPFDTSLRDRLDPPAWMDGGHRDFPLGTDRLGQDILSRLIYGARTSLLIGVVALLIGGSIGTTAGLVAGYFGRAVDEIIMTIVDIQLAFPFVLLAIAVIAVVGASLTTLIVVVGLSGWVTYARVTRARVLTLKEIGFIEAIRSVGAGNVRILLRHILPNTMSSLVVLATLELARLIILESTLSFLGLGVPPRTTPSWGSMIGEGREYLGSDQGWWISVFPGALLFVTALGVSRIGDWVRDVLDPTMKNNT